MKIISLGSTCYIKSLIKLTKYSDCSDIFDWINTFSLNDIISCLDNNFDICLNLQKISENSNTLYNNKYNFRMPHEKDNYMEYYTRRYQRFFKL